MNEISMRNQKMQCMLQMICNDAHVYINSWGLWSPESYWPTSGWSNPSNTRTNKVTSKRKCIFKLFSKHPRGELSKIIVNKISWFYHNLVLSKIRHCKCKRGNDRSGTFFFKTGQIRHLPFLGFLNTRSTRSCFLDPLGRHPPSLVFFSFFFAAPVN